MMTLADSTERIQRTTEQLSAGPLTPQAGVALIEQWLEPLMMAENTRPLAEKLQQLKAVLEGPDVNDRAVQDQVRELAEVVEILGSGMGSEGEMPSILTGLAASLRQTAQSSKADE